MTVTQGRRRLVPADSISSTCSCSCGRRAVMMVARRSRGEGSLFWNEKRQRWIGIVLAGLRRQRETSYDLGERANEDRSKDQACGRRSGLGMMVYRPVAATTPCGKRSSHG